MGTEPGCFVAQNVVELLPLGDGPLSALSDVRPSATTYTIEAACKALDARRVSLVFVGGRLQPPANLLPLALPAVGATLPRAAIQGLQRLIGNAIYLETSYLDEDFRIARGPGRELYVLSKRDD